VHAASTVAGGAAQAATSGDSNYAVDGLFRPDHIDNAVSTQDAASQAARILANGIRNGDVPPADRAYLAQLVAAKTGISQEDAEKRVIPSPAPRMQKPKRVRQQTPHATLRRILLSLRRCRY
jgi:hypothetical protein